MKTKTQKKPRVGFVPRDLPYDTHNPLEVWGYFWEAKTQDLLYSDPDNWLHIPNFHAQPDGSLAFNGQLRRPGAPHPEVRAACGHILKAARVLLKQHFVSIAEAEAAAKQYEETGEAFGWNWFEKPFPSRAMRAAVNYFSIVDGLEMCIDQSRPKGNLNGFLHAITLFSAWTIDTETRALEISREERRAMGKSAGQASGQARRTQERDARIVSAAKRLHWPHETRGIPKLVSQSFPLSPARIAQILRKALPNETDQDSSK